MISSPQLLILFFFSFFDHNIVLVLRQNNRYFIVMDEYECGELYKESRVERKCMFFSITQLSNNFCCESWGGKGRIKEEFVNSRINMKNEKFYCQQLTNVCYWQVVGFGLFVLRLLRFFVSLQGHSHLILCCGAVIFKKTAGGEGNLVSQAILV
eukprot:TRINITY_DN56002_c0_g1_i3.p2 TRINITY_DN56002_c0_g1~~TRINITY_DN56002_c0_g1_i3.p2  ORF type:complete len:154 (-),score=9.78 TRINITY_DN56002_c0_g1_i3:191-652(-)